MVYLDDIVVVSQLFDERLKNLCKSSLVSEKLASV
jgi:hypothetical protein